jgi:hypothetical protein
MRKQILLALVISLLFGCGNNKKGNQEEVTAHSVLMQEEQAPVTALDTTKFEILEEEVLPAVTNYYILYKGTINKDSVSKFVHDFRDTHYSKSNINIVDTKKIYPLIKEYPLKGEKYIKVADHFIAQSSFDCPSDVWWYPYQDIQYKEFGGKNWKKDPIE